MTCGVIQAQFQQLSNATPNVLPQTTPNPFVSIGNCELFVDGPTHDQVVF